MSEDRNLVGNIVRFAVRAFSRCPPLAGAAYTSVVSTSGYMPCHRLTGSKLLYGTFMNPAPIPGLRHPCAVKRSKRRRSLRQRRCAGRPRLRLPRPRILPITKSGTVRFPSDLENAYSSPKHKEGGSHKFLMIAVSAFKRIGSFPGVPKIPFGRHLSRLRQDRFGRPSVY